MSENLTNEEILRKKMEMESKITQTIDETITEVFKDRPQEEIEFHKETAYRVYQLDMENEELRHQLYYASSVTDALSSLLMEKCIITKEELAEKLEVIHEKQWKISRRAKSSSKMKCKNSQLKRL